MEAVVQRYFVKKMFLEIRQNSQENSRLYQSLFFNKVAGNLIKKETLAQVLSCEFCNISKNTFLNRTALVAASR